MFKLIGLFIIILALALSIGAQIATERKIPNLRLMLAAEKTTWVAGQSALVRVKIENLTGHEVEVSSTIYFKLDNRKSVAEGPTMANGVFWSPVSLTKIYDKDATGCQNDLTQARVEVLKGTNIVSITPAKDTLLLRQDENKEFTFDLAGTCWNHSISSVYPNNNLFSLLREHTSRFTDTNKFKVYLEYHFQVVKLQPSETKTPVIHRLKSNEVEITIN